MHHQGRAASRDLRHECDDDIIHVHMAQCVVAFVTAGGEERVGILEHCFEGQY